MAVSARDVAAALRQRLGGLSRAKEHKLLYYCQGHHLATFDEPLFRETVSAWKYGPVVGEYWYAQQNGEDTSGSVEVLDEAQLNTVGYVVSRYGRMSPGDLIKLTHAEAPWLRANEHRLPEGSVKIRNEWMAEYFKDNAADDEDEIPLDSETVSAWLREAAEERANDAKESRPIGREEMEAWLAGLRG